MRDTGQTSGQATDRQGPAAGQSTTGQSTTGQSTTGQGGRDREKQRVGIIGILTGAARVGRRHWWRILIAAITVSMVTTLAEIGVEEYVAQDDFPWSLIAGLLASGLSLLGAVFLSGFLTKLVGHSQESDSRAADSKEKDNGVSIRQVLRTLPWGRLIGADLLVALLVVIGLLLLVIPGLVAFNFLALVGPVIEVENRKIIAALRRSIHLVRGHFWSVALLATLPVVAASEIETAAPSPHGIGELLKVLAVRGLGEGIAEAVIGLILVQLTQRLMVLDRRAGKSENDVTSRAATSSYQARPLPERPRPERPQT